MPGFIKISRGWTSHLPMLRHPRHIGRLFSRFHLILGTLYSSQEECHHKLSKHNHNLITSNHQLPVGTNARRGTVGLLGPLRLVALRLKTRVVVTACRHRSPSKVVNTIPSSLVTTSRTRPTHLQQCQWAALNTSIRYIIILHPRSSNSSHDKTNPNRSGLTLDSSPSHPHLDICKQLSSTLTPCKLDTILVWLLATHRHQVIRRHATTWAVWRPWSQSPPARTGLSRTGTKSYMPTTLHFDTRLPRFTQFWDHLTNLHYEHIPANLETTFTTNARFPSFLDFCFLSL